MRDVKVVNFYSSLKLSLATAMRRTVLAAGFIGACICGSVAHATGVQYDLLALGGSDYRYIYTVENDGTLGAGMSIGLFDVMFDPALYNESSLTVTTPAVPGNEWDEIVLASAPGVPAAYDALALAGGIADGTAIGGFAVDFTWLGTGTPAGQPFAVYDPVSFALLEEGMTVSVTTVPLPQGFWLLASALASLLGFARTRRAMPADSSASS